MPTFVLLDTLAACQQSLVAAMPLLCVGAANLAMHKQEYRTSANTREYTATVQGYSVWLPQPDPLDYSDLGLGGTQEVLTLTCYLINV